MTTVLDDKNFQESIAQGVVVVDFYADWCGPCKMFAPTFDKLAQAFAGRATFAKVNVDEAQEVSAKYGIRSIPAFIVFKDGVKVDMKVGSMPEVDFSKWIETLL